MIDFEHYGFNLIPSLTSSYIILHYLTKHRQALHHTARPQAALHNLAKPYLNHSFQFLDLIIMNYFKSRKML